MTRSKNSLRDFFEKIKRFFRRTPGPPDDPYFYVPVPKKPKPPSRSAAAVMDRPE
jgi:hypothetical protein